MLNLPVLVYGTLRPGGGNYNWALKGRTIEEKTVRLNGLRMYAAAHGGFPYAAYGDEKDQLVADLITVEDKHYEQVLSSLDRLEGYYGVDDPRNFYDRLRFCLNINSTPIQAWIYLITDPSFLEGLVHVRNGDWLDFDAKLSQAHQAEEAVSTQEYKSLVS